MPKPGSSVARRRRHKRIVKRAKGYWGARRKLLRVAREAVMKAEEYMARDRRARKREMRSLWITRVNAAARERGMSYSRFVSALKSAGIEMNRKALSELAIHDPAAFEALFQAVADVAGARTDA